MKYDVWLYDVEDLFDFDGLYGNLLKFRQMERDQADSIVKIAVENGYKACMFLLDEE